MQNPKEFMAHALLQFSVVSMQTARGVKAEVDEHRHQPTAE